MAKSRHSMALVFAPLGICDLEEYVRFSVLILLISFLIFDLMISKQFGVLDLSEFVVPLFRPFTVPSASDFCFN